MRLEAVREQLVSLMNDTTAPPVSESNDLDWMDRANRIERIKHLVEQLEDAKPGSGEALELIKVIRRVLDTL
jgi:hypothetical protein